MKKRIAFLAICAVVSISIVGFSSCKSCNKSGADQAKTADSSAIVTPSQPINSINLPHADSSLAPVLSKLMDTVFDVCHKKDYVKLASYLAYRGPDMKRMGTGVFTTKNVYEKNVVRITGEVFNKWSSNAETKDYGRVFALPQPQDSRPITVLEVIFVSRKGVDRKFFGFVQLDGTNFKIVDVTSNLQAP